MLSNMSNKNGGDTVSEILYPDIAYFEILDESSQKGFEILCCDCLCDLDEDILRIVTRDEAKKEVEQRIFYQCARCEKWLWRKLK